MAVHLASEGVVTVGGNVVGSLRSYSLDTAAETVDQSILTSASKVLKAGSLSYSGSIEALWDETDAAQLAAYESQTVTLAVLPEGNTSGDYSYSVSAIINSVSISGAIDDSVAVSIGWSSSGDLTRGTV